MSDVIPPKYVPISKDEWNERWDKGIHLFHKDYLHEFLQKYADKLLQGRQGLKVLVPMCGKAFDMKWLADQDHTVVGVEWAKEAVLRFFKEQNLEYSEEPLPDDIGELYKSADGKIRIYRCNVYDFSSRPMEQDFDVIWDRAAFGILNPEDRDRYVKDITSLATPDCRILLATLVYDITKWPGPPHCIRSDEVQKLYGNKFSVEILDRKDAMQDTWRDCGITSLDEVLHLLIRK